MCPLRFLKLRGAARQKEACARAGGEAAPLSATEKVCADGDGEETGEGTSREVCPSREIRAAVIFSTAVARAPEFRAAIVAILCEPRQNWPSPA